MIKLNNKFWLAANKLMHSGKWSRNKAIAGSNRVAEYISKRCAEEGILASYDMSYGGAPHELMYTEIFGASGCIMIKPMDVRFWGQMLNKVESDVNPMRLKTLLEAGDKYNICNYPYSPSKVKEVLFLPGSNLLKCLPKKLIKDLVFRGVYIKPHPITTSHDYQMMMIDFGDKYLNLQESGWDLMKAANKVYCTGSTELGLYAALHDKLVIPLRYIDKEQHKEVYWGFYEHINKLKQLISTPLSGIIFNDDTYKEQVDAYLNFYKEMYDYATKNFLVMHKSWNC